MNHKGVQYTLIRSETPGAWRWQFRIGDLVRSGKTETGLPLLAMRRIQLKIDRELKHAAREPGVLTGRREARPSASQPPSPPSHSGMTAHQTRVLIDICNL
jgi:hypothetical protein